MTTFDDRDKHFENKFAHDNEMDFKVKARATKLLGLWAAGKLGKDDAAAYAASLLEADLEEPGTDDVVRKLEADFAAAGIAVTTRQLKDELENQTTLARQQLTGGQ